MSGPTLVGRRYLVDLPEHGVEQESMTELSWFADGSMTVRVVLLEPGVW